MQTAFKLALTLGSIHPLEVLKKLSSLELALWQAYDTVYPFGQSHTDYLIAKLITIVFNMWKSKDVEPMTINDVLERTQPLTEEYVTATIRSFNNGIN